MSGRRPRDDDAHSGGYGGGGNAAHGGGEGGNALAGGGNARIGDRNALVGGGNAQVGGGAPASGAPGSGAYREDAHREDGGGGTPFAREEHARAFDRVVDSATDDPALRKRLRAAARAIADGAAPQYAEYLIAAGSGRWHRRFPAFLVGVTAVCLGAVGALLGAVAGTGAAAAAGLGALVCAAAVGGALLAHPGGERDAALREERERRRAWLAALEEGVREAAARHIPATSAASPTPPSAVPPEPARDAAARTPEPEPASEPVPEHGRDRAAQPQAPSRADDGRRDRSRPRAPRPAAGPARSFAQAPVHQGPFLGRDDALALIARWAGEAGAGEDGTGESGAAPARSAPCVVVLHGPPGSGRTSLAVRAGELLGARYRGRCLVNLRGRAPEDGDGDETPLSTRDALLRLLDQLGTSKQDLLFRDAAARDTQVRRLRRRYQELLAGEPTVLVLDDAVDAAQVRPLIPENSPGLVLVTARAPLALDPGPGGTVHHLAVGELPEADARALFTAVAGPGPHAPGDEALLRAARGLPIAVCVAGAAVARASAGDRVPGPEEPETVLRHGYATLDPDARRLFRRLALVGRGTLGPAAAAALLGPEAPGGRAPDEKAAGRVLAALAAAHLAEQVPGGRYRLPDALRGFARRVLREEDPPRERAAAQSRLVADYAELAERVIHRVEGASSSRSVRSVLRAPAGGPAALSKKGDEALAAALRWLDEEGGVITAALREADDVDPAAVQRLVEALCDYCLLRGDLYRLGEIAELAQDLGEPVVRSVKLRTGIAARQLGQLDRARTTLSSLVGVYREGHDEAGAARALCSLGITLHHRGNLPEAADRLREALELQEPDEQRGDRAWTLHALGAVLRDQGRLEEAWRLLHAALKLHEETESLHGQAWTCLQLGQVHLRLGEVDEAEEVLWLSQELHRKTRDGRGEAWALTQLGRARLLRGETEDAVAELDRARTWHREHEDARGEAWTLYYLGQALEDTGRLDRAEDALSRARHMFSTMGDRYGHACARHHFGRVTRDRLAVRSGSLRNSGFARQLLQEARQDFRAVGLPHGEAWSCVELAVVDAACGRVPRAAELLADAQELFEGLRDTRGTSWAVFLRCTLLPLTSDDGLRTARATLERLTAAPGCDPVVAGHAARWLDGPWLDTGQDGPWPVWRRGLTPSRRAREVLGVTVERTLPAAP